MNDYWLTQYVLRAFGWAYVVVAFLALAVALWAPKTLLAKAICAIAVLLASAVLPFRAFEDYQKEVARIELLKKKRETAIALFEERCKAAGERIYKKVEGIDGLRLLKMRPEYSRLGAQFELDDPYGTDLRGEGYPHSMLWVRRSDGVLDTTVKAGRAYRYVIYPQKSGEEVQAELGEKPKAGGELEVIEAPVSDRPQYGVTFEDISSRQDRLHWIAGSRLAVVDLQTKEIIAERIGWMMDVGLGDTKGERSPWLFAAYNACPQFPLLHGTYPQQRWQTRNFVEKVLVPRGTKK